MTPKCFLCKVRNSIHKIGVSLHLCADCYPDYMKDYEELTENASKQP